MGAVVVVAHLDIRESLEAHGMGADIAPYIGETLYRLAWISGDRRREGFCSACNPQAAKRLLVTHEAGYGRPVAQVSARRWGSRADLGDWASSRASH